LLYPVTKTPVIEGFSPDSDLKKKDFPPLLLRSLWVMHSPVINMMQMMIIIVMKIVTAMMMMMRRRRIMLVILIVMIIIREQ